ncbi:MAG TPA: hypothetical protein DER09_08635, partial [Prolixibacteraceae bacterium]|nr:hypothetical protein [Prolixibacteraceae bacterium]
GSDDSRVRFRTTNFGQGAYMALPIVGSFYVKVNNDAKVRKYAAGSFNPPAPEMLALLDVPTYQEIMDIEDNDFNLADIFRRKVKPERLKPVEKKEEPKTQETTTEKPVWTKIKSIFKKKEK